VMFSQKQVFLRKLMIMCVPSVNHYLLAYLYPELAPCFQKMIASATLIQSQ